MTNARVYMDTECHKSVCGIMSAFSLSICAVVDINRFDYMSYAVFVFIFLGLLGQFGHYY